MDSRQTNHPQLKRERVVYDYLEALENGDIDGIIASLQSALYDAPLAEILMDTHQMYLQDEQAQQATLTEENTHETPVLEAATLPSRGAPQRSKAVGKRMPRWIQVLAALLILSVLVGSFLTIVSLRKGNKSVSPGLTPIPACQPYTLKQANVPVPANSSSSLGAVASVSANDAWAVGYSFPRSSAFGIMEATTLIEHWDGKSWQIVQSPNGANGYGQLSAVAAISADNVWAVGVSSGPKSSDQDHTLIEHWNGEKWQVVTNPSELSNSGVLVSLSVVSANDIWAVGNLTDAQQVTRPLLEHWNGSLWTRYAPSSGAQTGGALIGVAAISANNVWAVGQAGMAQGLTMHWNGSQWRYETLPGWREIFSISAISANDFWITGLGTQGWTIGHSNGLGVQNRAIPMPVAGKGSLLFRQIYAVSDNDIWALGDVSSSTSTSLAVWHWNGKVWQQVGSPAQISAGQSNSAGYGIAISGAQQAWIVGKRNDSLLILGQQSCL